MQIITQMLLNAFPGTKVFPVLGNHDYFPSNGVPDRRNPVFEVPHNRSKKQGDTQFYMYFRLQPQCGLIG